MGGDGAGEVGLVPGVLDLRPLHSRRRRFRKQLAGGVWSSGESGPTPSLLSLSQP